MCVDLMEALSNPSWEVQRLLKMAEKWTDHHKHSQPRRPSRSRAAAPGSNKID
jgi:hypothetical protein